jgi:hypothetical protein
MHVETFRSTVKCVVNIKFHENHFDSSKAVTCDQMLHLVELNRAHIEWQLRILH